MLNFTLKTTLGDRDENIKQVVIGTEINGKYYNTFELMGSSNLSNSIYLDSSDDVDFPYLVCDTYIQDVTQIYKIFQNSNFKTSDEMMAKVVKILEGKFNDMFNLELLRKLESMCEVFSRYIKGERVKIKIPVNWYKHVVKTTKLVNAINESGRAESIYIEGENKTLFRVDPEDELFIMVPDYVTLKTQGVNVNPNDVSRPYLVGDGSDDKKVEEKLRTPEFKDYLNDSITMEDIVGNPANNDLDILPSETRYRNALIELMNSGIAMDFPDKTLEECQKNNIGSKVVKEYIKELIMCAAYLNWAHSGYLPLRKEYESEEDEYDLKYSERENEKSSELGNNVFGGYSGRDQSNIVDGEYIIHQLVDREFTKDIYSIIDIAIKMFRFGKLKPSRIKLTSSPDGTSRYLDPTTLMFYSTSGNYSAIDIEYDEDGSNLTPLCSIKMMSYISDNSYIKKNNIKHSTVDMNIGVLCERRFKGDKFTQKVLLSYIDIIKAYEGNEPLCKIKGFSYADGVITIDASTRLILDNESRGMRDLIPRLLNSESGEFQFYCYSGFKDSFMVKNCFDTKLSVLRILNDYFGSSDLMITSACAYETLEELDLKCEQFSIPPKACIESNMARYLIPIVCDVAYLYEKSITSGKEFKSNDIIFAFSEVMKNSGFIGTFGLETTVKPAVPENKSLEKSTSFGKSNNEESKSNGRDKFLDNVIKGDLEGYRYVKLVLNKTLLDKLKVSFKDLKILEVDPDTGDAVIGTLGYKSDKDPKVFIDPAKGTMGATSKLNFTKTCPGLMGILAKSLTGGAPSNRFDSVECGVYYCRLGNQVYSKLVEMLNA